MLTSVKLLYIVLNFNIFDNSFHKKILNPPEGGLIKHTQKRSVSNN